MASAYAERNALMAVGLQLNPLNHAATKSYSAGPILQSAKSINETSGAQAAVA